MITLKQKQLWESAIKGSVSGIETALKTSSMIADADINALTPKGWTALWHAVWRNKVSAVRMLLEHHADPNKATYYNAVPLTGAVIMNNLDIVKLLVEHGADVNRIDHGGKTPLSYLSLHENNGIKLKLKIARLLVEYGANPNTTDLNPPLLFKAVMARDEELARFFIEHNADIEAKDKKSQCTALLAALKRDMPEMATHLIQIGANVNVKDEDGVTPLMVAARNGDMDMVQLLLTKGAHVFDKDNMGASILKYAVLGGRVNIVRLLEKQGLDIREPDKGGKTPYMWNRKKKNFAMKQYFQKCGLIPLDPNEQSAKQQIIVQGNAQARTPYPFMVSRVHQRA